MTNMEKAKVVVEAINTRDREKYFGAFVEATEVKLSDDDRPRDFVPWSEREVFANQNTLTLNKETEEGSMVRLEGEYATAHLGTFKTFWAFTFNEEGQITRMDVGAL